MSATEFYLEKGFTPTFKSVVVSESATVTVWTPSTSTRVVLTGMQIAANLAGTFTVYLGNLAGTRLFFGALTGSTTVSHDIHFDCLTSDRTIHFTGTPGSTGGWVVNLQGFEISS